MKKNEKKLLSELKESIGMKSIIKHRAPFASVLFVLAVTIFIFSGCAGSEQSAIKSIEERVSQLEEINKIYKKRIERLNDIQEIQNMMGRYVWLHEVQRDPELIELFAKNQPDVSWEVAHLGLYEGREAVKEILDAHGPRGGSVAPGTLFLHTLTTPVIEIAEDGQTAKGVWHSPGAETLNDPLTGDLRGFWAWTKYACDFIKEDGEWKIWHYHVYRIFLTPADMNYTDEYESKVMSDAMGGDRESTSVKPTTYDNPFSKKYVPELVPAPPEPYETFSKTFSYGPLKK